ncbi:methyltransferase domain-containing protein [Altererythrobacter xixiisoli]|uniref:Methyltransferase domain-containing protein n=2 Tax=Croceibacterium xixiisoli TaxID=1476466 RepID=A0A6I4TZ55_9SPHN|nr:methyltransferase domain-containing protein [Croceibacterium xixiisoli]
MRAAAARSNPEAAPFVLEAMAEDVLDRLSFIRFEPQRALVIGDWASVLAPALAQAGAIVIQREPGDFDEEAPLADGPFDLIVSLQVLDTVNDLPGALIHARHALSPGGLLMASFLGVGSLPALRGAMMAADGDRPAARIHPQIDTRAGAALLQRAGFSRQVADSNIIRASYRSLRHLVRDLRWQGLTSMLRSRAPSITRAGLKRAEAAFLSSADDQGRVTEIFEIVTLTGWRD